jgi:RNA polymerase sigma-70 factor, ECF subfamily
LLTSDDADGRRCAAELRPSVIGIVVMLKDRRAATMRDAMALAADPDTTPWAETIERLRRFVASRVSDPELAADIVQDVLLRSVAAGALEHVDDLKAWLYRSARNAVIDHYRTKRAHEPILDEERWPDLITTEDGPNEATRELARCLEPLIHQLPPTARDALTRVDIVGQTHQQAADQLGISVSGMKSRVQRARRELRTLLTRCCKVTLDRDGALTDFEPQAPGCGCP